MTEQRDVVGAMSGAPRVAVISGGAGALGTAIAHALQAKGDRVCSIDIAPAMVGDLHIGADLRSPVEVERAIDRVTVELGTPTYLVNTAFVSRRGSSVEMSVEDWDTVMATNVRSYWLMARTLARRWISGEIAGSVVNVSSICGSNAVGRGGTAYGVSKAAILQLTRELAVEWAPHGIRVNSVQPAQVGTPGFESFLADSAPAVRDDIFRGLPLGRLAAPDEVADAVLFLLSDRARFITGASLPVDGGNLATNAGASIRLRS